MEIAYSGDAFHTYMVISSEEWGENEDEEKMMSNQSAQVLLPFQVQRLNDRKNYCYDISGRMEFRSYIERKQADRSMIKSVIRFIAGLDQAVEEYLLYVYRARGSGVYSGDNREYSRDASLEVYVHQYIK